MNTDFANLGKQIDAIDAERLTCHDQGRWFALTLEKLDMWRRWARIGAVNGLYPFGYGEKKS